MNPVPVIFADIRQNRLGVSLVVLLIAVAVGMGIGISSQERALRLASNRAADPFDLIIGAPGSKTQLLLSTVYLQAAAVPLIDGRLLCDLQENPHVQYAAPIGFGDFHQGYTIIGTARSITDLAGKRPLLEGSPFSHTNEAVIGRDVKMEMGTKFYASHGHAEEEHLIGGEKQEHHALQYTVTGRMQRWGNPWDKAILVPIEAVWFLHGLGFGHSEQGLSSLSAPSHTPQHSTSQLAQVPIGPPWDPDIIPGIPAVVLGIDKPSVAYKLRSHYNRGKKTMAFFPAEVLLQLNTLLGDAGSVLALLALSTQVLVVSSVLLAVFASLTQKKRQLGVLRALGASRSYVFTVIWGYVVSLVSSGAILGIGVGWIAARILAFYLEGKSGLSLTVSVTKEEIYMAATLVGASMFLALIPAVAIYRERVSALLRM